MTFHVLTIFPEFFRGPFEHGVIQRAREAGLIEIRVHDLRNWTQDRHRTVDDRPFGGGEGMLLKAGPIFEAVESIWPERGPAESGSRCSRRRAGSSIRRLAREYRGLDELLLICGRYEGVDERVAEHLADEEISIGDYVLSGGELAAAVVIDAVAQVEGRRAGQSRFGGGGVVQRGRLARLPAVYPAGGVSRLEGAGSAARGQPRGDPAVAEEGGARENRAASAGFVEKGNSYAKRSVDQDPEQE